MSSITKRPNGHRWLCFKFRNKRHTLRLGKVEDSVAREVQRRLDVLIEHAAAGLAPPAEIAVWLTRIDERLYKNLFTAGLVAPRGPSILNELITAHEEALQARGRKPSTLHNNCVLHSNLRKYFGETRRLDAISLQEADLFRRHLLEKGSSEGGPLARATVSNRCRRARSMFAFAVKNGWLQANPFREIATGREWNPARDKYIPLPIFAKILDKTADHELRCLLALVRICGLRCPSELQPLAWGAVDWDNGVLVVHSSKTEEFDSGRREVPLFEGVLPYLYALSERCEDNTTLALMFPRHQKTGAAITGRLSALCRKAGEVLWSKPFVNLRASGERDALKAGHTIDDVSRWWGHSPEIALRHYRRVVKEQTAKLAAGALRVVDSRVDPKQKAKRRSDVSRTDAN